MIPQLRQIEERFADTLVVVGVHSAKFDAERQSENLRAAVLRYGIRHAVVNDADFRIWQEYAVRAWPTLMLVNPDGRVIGKIEGEFEGNVLSQMVDEVVREFDAQGKINRAPIAALQAAEQAPNSALLFPSKLLADPVNGRIFIADTGHHRVLEVSLASGEILRAIGSGKRGYNDGPLAAAAFDSPHGLALRANELYVADTENHAIRRIDLQSGAVSTVAGNGQQARPLPEEGHPLSTSLNSPWDLAFAGDGLIVAMAGAHQLWQLDLAGNRLSPFAGSGRENIIDAPAASAALAQPSGLSVDGGRVYFADSEVSAVRWLPADGSGAVSTLVGTGLFDFGDEDGVGDRARLQHPLAVAAAGNMVYVADTYNHKIKRLDVTTRRVSSFLGSGQFGLRDGEGQNCQFWEPGGLSLTGDTLFIADTNNHAVRVADLKTGAVSTLQLGVER